MRKGVGDHDLQISATVDLCSF